MMHNNKCECCVEPCLHYVCCVLCAVCECECDWVCWLLLHCFVQNGDSYTSVISYAAIWRGCERPFFARFSLGFPFHQSIIMPPLNLQVNGYSYTYFVCPFGLLPTCLYLLCDSLRSFFRVFLLLFSVFVAVHSTHSQTIKTIAIFKV